jgi:hypothetical protein
MGSGSKWGANEFSLTNVNFSVSDNSLLSAVKMLKATTKQAFYGAILRNGVLRRRTWDGCAFNAGSLELELQGQSAISFESAAQIFGESPAVVKRFISAWDTSNYSDDREATVALTEMLESVGIFTDPDSPTIEKPAKPKRRIVIEVVHESTMTDAELLEEFKDVVLHTELDKELTELLESAESCFA